MSVGFVGLGNMGQGMVDNLLEKGADLTVFTRTQSKIEAMIDRGAKGASSVAELTQNVDVVLVCLPDVQTSHNLLIGDNGVFENARPGQVIVDHGTVDIATSRACAKAAEAKGVHFLDAPISGGPGGAADGTLAIMVGGTEEAFELANEYFVKMGANVKLMGPTGAGTAMKLINQLLVGVHTVAAAEAFALANSAGVDVQIAADLLAVSWGGSTMIDRNAPITVARGFPDSAAPLRLIHKDLNIIKDLASDEGLSLELALKAEEMFQSMMDQGKKEHDISAVLEIVEERSN
ncbi:MAG: NAD(P)-dependent oxidoreductase [Dehalococcoidia bacterium]|nr:NAD(P)-dependent oxidoreductase [Dehalococcoidia bacterium]